MNPHYSELETETSQMCLIERLVNQLCPHLSGRNPINWSAYRVLRSCISQYEVPATSCSILMSQFLFALSQSVAPKSIIAVGTYVGYCASWLLGTSDCSEIEQAVFIDVNPLANSTAVKNCALLGFGERLNVITSRAEDFLVSNTKQIDLLFIDIDDPQTGKAKYKEVLERMLPILNPGALVVAHDPIVPKFKEDFERYHRYIKTSSEFFGPWVIPLDSCGVSLAARRS